VAQLQYEINNKCYYIFCTFFTKLVTWNGASMRHGYGESFVRLSPYILARMLELQDMLLLQTTAQT